MFFHPVYEGSVGLSVVLRRAVEAGDFVDGVGGEVKILMLLTFEAEVKCWQILI